MNTNAPIGTENNMMAPWNQIDNQEIDRDCVITETISRKVILSTTDYIEEEDLVDTSNTNWFDEYSSQEYTALELIDRLKSYIEEDIRNTSPNTSKGKELQRLLSACNGWEKVELEVEEC